MRSVEIVNWLSGIVVVGFCLFLIGLAVVIATMPALAERFLRSFASSAHAHYTEQGLRLLVGAAVVNLANSMRYPELVQAVWLAHRRDDRGPSADPMAMAPQVQHEGNAACNPIHAAIRAWCFRVGSVYPLLRVRRGIMKEV